ncbi:hypothetical protein PR202_ga05479 [Eleusine coracana subsp. coracana]|uniref:TF-B3 domain-containing protein n=1 Tax=Eleusine coracana subsp. coracana TaxID=191504 RepID=A0AAV5BT41_ELECO|nr:hypothetical protein PR202_ga05026 [Eleusine coracana subsp. coracana]GJM89301.1 hypothetical protein PR202_ga05479 [Eleusine coracana subsp. coracana]
MATTASSARLRHGVRGAAQEAGPREPQAPRGDNQPPLFLPSRGGVSVSRAPIAEAHPSMDPPFPILPLSVLPRRFALGSSLDLSVFLTLVSGSFSCRIWAYRRCPRACSRRRGCRTRARCFWSPTNMPCCAVVAARAHGFGALVAVQSREEDTLEEFLLISSNSVLLKRAEKLKDSLDPENPSFVKTMVRSHVSRLLLAFSAKRTFLPEEFRMVLEDEEGGEFDAVYIGNRTGLSGGWRGFAMHHNLEDGDSLVFELAKPDRFKIYIIKAIDDSIVDEAESDDKDAGGDTKDEAEDDLPAAEPPKGAKRRKLRGRR